VKQAHLEILWALLGIGPKIFKLQIRVVYLVFFQNWDSDFINTTLRSPRKKSTSIGVKTFWPFLSLRAVKVGWKPQFMEKRTQCEKGTQICDTTSLPKGKVLNLVCIGNLNFSTMLNRSPIKRIPLCELEIAISVITRTNTLLHVFKYIKQWYMVLKKIYWHNLH